MYRVLAIAIFLAAAVSGLKLKRSGAEETAPTEYALLHQDKPQIDEAPKSGHAPGSGDSRPRDLVDENLTGNLDGGQLQLFLGTKVCKKTALAHAKLGGEGTDGQAVEAVHGGDVHGAGEDGFASAKAASLRARSTGLARGTGNGWHEKIVTRVNK